MSRPTRRDAVRRTGGRSRTVHSRLLRRLVGLAAGLLAAAAGSLVLASPAAAHPLGNFTVNQYSGLRVQPDAVVVDYVLDLAEIPTFQTRSQLDTNRDGGISQSESDSWRAASCARLAGQLQLTVDGAPAALAVTASTLTFPRGAAGLETLRLDCTLRTPVRLDRGRHLSYRDGAYTDRVGWREVTAVGDGTTLTGSTVPATSPSGRLTAYPADLLSAPLDVRSAELDARPGGLRLAPLAAPGGPAAPLARGVDRATSAFTSLVARRNLTVAFGLVAVLLSVLLGALHALAPGHGKTVMAAFLVGGRGSLRQALTIGLTVTATHTAGVLVLGAVLTTSVALAPQTLYPWLGIASGLVLAGVGVSLLRRVRGGADLTHSHPHPHGHSHHHPHQHPEPVAVDPGRAEPQPAPALVGGSGRGRGPSPDLDHLFAEPAATPVPALALAAAASHATVNGHSVAYVRDVGPDDQPGPTTNPANHEAEPEHGHEHGHDHVHDDLPVAGPGHSRASNHEHGQQHAPGHEHGHRHGHDGDHDDLPAARPGHSQDGDHEHGQGHEHGHGHGHGGGSPVMRRRGLLAMGFAGGLVPSPSALVVLLGAVALGRTWFGILLVVGYGAGMAAALMGIGLLLARGRRLLERRAVHPRLRSIAARLPLATAALVVIVGVGLALQAAAALMTG